uniref:Zinc finger MYM-type protein 1 n=1 Tax=Lygus hesperus TaxID=30085 RepID=A0A0A9Z2A6_LYGHE
MNDISPEFTEKRKRKRKTMYDELCEDEAVTRTPEELFIASMLQISDRLIMEMSTRFKSLENINDKFGFLNGGQINEMTLDDLKLKAGELADTYKEDLNKKELILEIESFKGFALGVDNNLKTSSASTTLELILKNKLEEMYPNITTGLKIFLTLPVSVATGERSFSKLKLVKNHLRSSMSQQRLTDLSIITIEHKRASNISFDKVIKEFASKKSRKVIIRD